MASVFTRVQEDDPSRCQAAGGFGQCHFHAVGSRESANAPWVGPKYCPMHGGMGGQHQEKIQNQRLYMSALWKDKIGEQAYHPKYKSLREEMGILRMTLERRLDACKSDQDLLMYAGGITEMVREIGKMAKIAHAIEKDMGHLLDKTQAESWVSELVGIISQFITDPGDLQQISEAMVASLAERTTI